MKRIIILTGNESRHQYFRKKISNDIRFETIRSFCEGSEKSLAVRTNEDIDASILEKWHVEARQQAETDFFEESISLLEDLSRAKIIKKGGINDELIVKNIIDLNPDIIICYGSSIIKSELLNSFKGRFLNVHLGLSPYYRGSGTNVWPLINNEPFMVGATFMYIDPGIDTGEIIHQIRPQIFLGDSPHSIGNRLIRDMTNCYADIIANFENLLVETQPINEGLLFKMADFSADSCKKLYDNFNSGMISKYLAKNSKNDLPYIVCNKGLKKK
jgi:phosphoribosylglycinamide formyltransferase 1